MYLCDAYVNLTISFMLLQKAQIIALVFLVFTGLSCKEDDKGASPTASLIGEWLRNDASESFEFTLVFYEDNTGLQTVREDHTDGTGISSASTFDWTQTEDQLTLDLNGTPVTTDFSFTEDGQLRLPGISDVPFDRVE